MRNAIEELLYKLTAAKAKMVRAEIDAGACGTSVDLQRYHTAEREYDATFEQVTSALLAMVK